MKAIQIISHDVFDKIRSRFQNLEMGDETGAVTIDPTEARFFDFDFVNEGVNLGRVSISLNDLGSLKVYYSQGITENQDDPAKKVWFRFLKEMRMFAMRRLLRFDTRDIAKTNLDRNDFQYLATKSNKEKEMPTQMNESRWNQKSSRKTSRAVKGTTEVIVRHHSPVDEMYAGARSQKKNIKAIFIQNRDGERFKYPFIHPAGAFAMAQHVDHGGVPHDGAGRAIIKMSEQIAQLQEFQRQVQHASLHDDAIGIAGHAKQRLGELKSCIESLSKRHHYESWLSEFNETEMPGNDIMELDAVTMEQYKDKFTQTNFKEELAQFFPLIHKIMQETNALNLEDYVSEGDGEECETCHKDPCECDEEVKESAFDAFEDWANATEQGKLTDDQVESLKQALADLETSGQKLDLTTAFNFFNEFGIEDSDLQTKFQQANDLDPATDPMEVFQVWAKDSYPELLVALGMSGTGEQEPAPEQPSPEQPVAEGMSEVHEVMQDIARGDADPYDVMNHPTTPAEQAASKMLEKMYYDISSDHGLHPDDDFEKIFDIMVDQIADEYGTGDDEFEDSADENSEMTPPPGAMESADPREMVKEVAKIVKSFYNRDNPEVGPFRGGEGIVIDVEKQISEKFGEEAGAQAAQMAEAFMEKLTNEWQERHGKTAGVADDGLARLKELVGNIKQKVEGIGDQGTSGQDFNTNIMTGEGESEVAEGSAHGWNVVRAYEKSGGNQLKITRWLRKEAGLPIDAPVYFDDADLVYGDQTIVRDALVNPKLKMQDLLDAVTHASQQSQPSSPDQSTFEAIMRLVNYKK
jgi:hypothetical protein